MLRGTYLFVIYLLFLVLGASAPFIACLGYVWVDIFTPQDVGGMILSLFPVSLFMGVAAILGYIVFDRRRPTITPMSVLLILFAIWVTFTTSVLAEVPAAAWEKWSYAFKTICFAAFIPVVFRSRVQIEAFLQIFLFSTSVHFLPIGIKTVVSGGGYGQDLGITGGNTLLSEGATIASVSLMLVPIALYLRGNTIIFPKRPITSLLYLGFAFAGVTAAIGTFERTGLVGMVVLAVGVWVRSRRKIAYGIAIVGCVISVGYFASSGWNARISTIQQYSSESSALGRILVWKWTANYVTTHPFGGGFNAYKIDKIVFPADQNGNSQELQGVAFHSIYFEVLGEQGYLGLGMYLLIAGWSFYNLQRAAWRAKRREADNWARELAYALQVSLATLLVCGCFVGIAFQPMLYYLFAMSACLWQCVRSLSAEEKKSFPYEADIFGDEQVHV